MPLELQGNQEIQVALALIYKLSADGTPLFFLQNRIKDGTEILWEFVGGKIESHEGVVDALVREIQEELRLGADAVREEDIKYFHTYRYSYGFKEFFLNCYLVRCHEQSTIHLLGMKESSANFNWFSLLEMQRRNFPLIVGSRQILSDLNRAFE